jgi:hypothetical protein
LSASFGGQRLEEPGKITLFWTMPTASVGTCGSAAIACGSVKNAAKGQIPWFSLAKVAQQVFLNGMNAAICEIKDPDIQAQALALSKGQLEQWFMLQKGTNGSKDHARGADIQSRIHETTVRQAEQWFEWMDGMLEVHRSMFVFREPSQAHLEEHKAGIKLAIEYSLFIKDLIADPEFNEPDLVSRLQVRIQQLQDAYDTFHDPQFSNAEAEELLKQVFPG